VYVTEAEQAGGDSAGDAVAVWSGCSAWDAKDAVSRPACSVVR